MLDKLTTEKRNNRTNNLDEMTSLEICTIMNEEDRNVPLAIEKVLPKIAEAIDIIATKVAGGGRLIYVGAGTSGRIGLMDAVECVPTFGVPDDMVIGLIAGGQRAFVKAVEGAEDSKELAITELKELRFSEKDVLVGIAASGRTPYVISALEYAGKIGSETIAISCNQHAAMSQYAHLAIEIDAGSEVLTGSTRLKAGTTQKLVLNMISTGAMIRMGKVYKNLMVDVMMTNEKLEERGRKIIIEATGVDYQTADSTLKTAENNVKTAIVMILAKCDYREASRRLQLGNGFVRTAIE